MWQPSQPLSGASLGEGSWCSTLNHGLLENKLVFEGPQMIQEERIPSKGEILTSNLISLNVYLIANIYYLVISMYY